MGDFVYQGEHSITIDPDGLNLNTWTSFKMAPQARPFVASPPIKEEYVDVPGADGALDYTEVLTGRPRYGRRTGSWNFIVDNDGQAWPAFYSRLLTLLHGKYFNKIVLDDDPEYCYRGRLTLTGAFGNKDYSSVQIAYNLDPYKYPIGTTAGENWKWDEFIQAAQSIYFGRFTVSGKKLRDILNSNDTATTANINLTSPIVIYDFKNFNDDFAAPDKGVSSALDLSSSGTMSLDQARAYCLLNSNFDERFCPPTYTLTGDNEISLRPGSNVMYFVGNGIVTVEYERGKTL